MQDPIQSSIPTMTFGMTEARATLESPVQEMKDGPKTSYRFTISVWTALAKRLVIIPYYKSYGFM
jgi:hypothetical protein